MPKCSCVECCGWQFQTTVMKTEIYLMEVMSIKVNLNDIPGICISMHLVWPDCQQPRENKLLGNCKQCSVLWLLWKLTMSISIINWLPATVIPQHQHHCTPCLQHLHNPLRPANMIIHETINTGQQWHGIMSTGTSDLHCCHPAQGPVPTAHHDYSGLHNMEMGGINNGGW